MENHFSFISFYKEIPGWLYTEKLYVLRKIEGWTLSYKQVRLVISVDNFSATSSTTDIICYEEKEIAIPY